MWFGINDYQVEWLIKERAREARREAEHIRLIRAATRSKKPHKRWGFVTSAFRRLRATLTDRVVGEPGCQSPSTAVGPACNCSAS